MGALETPESFKDFGNPYPAPTSHESRRGHLSCEFGECGVVVRAGTKVQQSGDRREQSIQRSVDQKIQGVEETSKEFSTSHNTDGNTDTTGNGRSLVTSWHIGLGLKTANKPDKVSGHLPTARSDEPTHKSCILLETKTRG